MTLAAAEKIRSSYPSTTRPTWQAMTWKFPNERDCLASFVVLEAAEVLEGAKPANLVQLRNRRQPCGRNLHLLWSSYGDELLSKSPLSVLTLRQKESGDLMLFFSPKLLQKHLQHFQTSAFLKRLGYRDPSNLEVTLSELQRRFHSGPELPHEIGIFLGYPLKDVAGFMGCSNKPCTACRLWRIYGDPAPSLALSDRYTACRRGMAARLTNDAANPVLLLQDNPLAQQMAGIH